MVSPYAPKETVASSISLEEDVDLFCDFARRHDRTAMAEAVNLIYRSRFVPSSFEDSQRDGAESRWNPAWSEVEYKEYPRFNALQLPVPSDEQDVRRLLRAETTRKSCRSFGPDAIQLKVLAAALFIAHADRKGFQYPSRAFPSAGGLYCVETYLVIRRVSGLANGVYHYAPQDHCLHVLRRGPNAWKKMCIAIDQPIGEPAAFVVESVRLRPLLSKYGLRGFRFALMEAGAASEALDLAATSLGLASLWLGGFGDEDVWDIVGVSPLQEVEIPLLILALGHESLADRPQPKRG